jgi:hypothetical protein
VFCTHRFEPHLVSFYNHNFSSYSVFLSLFFIYFSISCLFSSYNIYFIVYIFLFPFYFLFVFFDRSVLKYSISYSCMYMKNPVKLVFWTISCSQVKKMCRTSSRTSACTGKTHYWHGSSTYCANKTYDDMYFYFHFYRLCHWSA